MFTSEKENNDVKMIIPYCIADYITIAMSLQIITITCFLKIMQSYFAGPSL